LPEKKTAQGAKNGCGSGREHYYIFPPPHACKSRIVSVFLQILITNQNQIPPETITVTSKITKKTY
ncbi:MAG: hypothetical protein PHS38_09865, partial [Bacteroidales bacterium]|nr:hypothetical protein [Bacteroidales bacterium]